MHRQAAAHDGGDLAADGGVPGDVERLDAVLAVREHSERDRGDDGCDQEQQERRRNGKDKLD